VFFDGNRKNLIEGTIVMKKTQWMLLVLPRAGKASAKSFQDANGAEAAAYIAKVANPDAKVMVQRDPRFGLLWERGAWHVLALEVEGSGPLAKRASDFAAARREHDLMCQAAACGVTFFR
jgi:hypothetical protein